MNGGVLLIPFLAVRFLLPSAFDSAALRRAAYFAPMQGSERLAYGVYQISNTGIFLYLFFLKISAALSWPFCAGAACYGIGLCLLSASLVAFSRPDCGKMKETGLYRLSRNPMYVAYFICFLGMALLTRSVLFLGLVAVFQISAHWVILAEERWCLEQFGERYRRYMGKVRRYI